MTSNNYRPSSKANQEFCHLKTVDVICTTQFMAISSTFYIFNSSFRSKKLKLLLAKLIEDKNKTQNRT